MEYMGLGFPDVRFWDWVVPEAGIFSIFNRGPGIRRAKREIETHEIERFSD
jgi:hypothetical protein